MLEIRDIQASEGAYGAVRRSRDYLAGDEIFFRFVAMGLQSDPGGKINLDLRVAAESTSGQLLAEHRQKIQGGLTFGGGMFPCTAQMTSGRSTPPGFYRFRVDLHDQVSGAKANLIEDIQILKPQFALVSPRFFHDKAGEAAATPSGFLGQKLYFKLKLIGMEATDPRIDLETVVRAFDLAGNPLNTPDVSSLIYSDPKVIRETESLTLEGDMVLNQPGDFLFQFEVHDRVKGRTARFETTIKIHPIPRGDAR